jgi:hypothetical protein
LVRGRRRRGRGARDSRPGGTVRATESRKKRRWHFSSAEYAWSGCGVQNPREKTRRTPKSLTSRETLQENITMAAILITVKNNLYTIQLDQWDWTGLTVNGTAMPKVNGYYTYTQTTPGSVEFAATANYVSTLNPGNTFFMRQQYPPGVAQLLGSGSTLPVGWRVVECVAAILCAAGALPVQPRKDDGCLPARLRRCRGRAAEQLPHTPDRSRSRIPMADSGPFACATPCVRHHVRGRRVSVTV